MHKFLSGSLLVAALVFSGNASAGDPFGAEALTIKPTKAAVKPSKSKSFKVKKSRGKRNSENRLLTPLDYWHSLHPTTTPRSVSTTLPTSGGTQINVTRVHAPVNQLLTPSRNHRLEGFRANIRSRR